MADGGGRTVLIPACLFDVPRRNPIRHGVAWTKCCVRGGDDGEEAPRCRLGLEEARAPGFHSSDVGERHGVSIGEINLQVFFFGIQ